MKEKIKNTMTAIGGIGLLVSLLLLCPALADEGGEQRPTIKAVPKPIPEPTTHDQDDKWYTMGDAVEAVTQSDMWSDDIKSAIRCISHPLIDMSSARYQAICKIAESDMWSYDKVDSIGRICGYLCFRKEKKV